MTGDNCTVYNTNVSSAAQLSMLTNISNASQQMLDAQAPLEPMCMQEHTQCAGWGALAYGEGAAPASLPICALSYSDPSKTWHGKREPVETICSEVRGV